MSESEVSRRALLAGAAIGVGVAGVAAAGVGAAQAESLGSAPADPVKGLPSTIVGSDWRWRRTDGVVGRTSGDLRTDDGVTGRFRSTPLDTETHLHVLTLADGIVIAIGSGLTAGAYAVLGGTGRYAGVTGAYSAEQSPKGRDGDGTALFTLALRSS